MENWDYVAEATTTSINSQGSAMKEQAVYMGSYEAKLNVLKSRFSEMALAMGDDFLNDAILNVMELGRVTIDVVSSIIKHVGLIPTAFGGIGIAIDQQMKKANGGKGMLDGIFGDGKMFDMSKLKDGFKKSVVDMKNIWATASTGMAGGFAKFQSAGMTAISGLKVGLAGLASVAGPMLIFAGIGKLIEHISSNIAKAREVQEAFNKQMNDTSNILTKHKGSVDDIVNEYSALRIEYEKQGDALPADKLARYNELTNDLATMMPGMIDHLDENGNTHLKSSEAIKAESENLKRLIDIQEKSKFTGFLDNIKEQSKQLKDLGKEFESYSRRIKDAQANEGGNLGLFDRVNRGITDFFKGQDTLSDSSVQKLEIERLQMMSKYSSMWDQARTSINEATVAQLKHESGIKNLTTGAEKFIANYTQGLQEIDFDKVMGMDNTAKQNYFETQALEMQIQAKKMGEMVGKMYDDIAQGIPPEKAKVLLSSVDTVMLQVQEKLQANIPKDKWDEVFNDMGESFKKANSGDIASLQRNLQGMGFSLTEANNIIKEFGKSTGNTAIENKRLSGELGIVDEELAEINQKYEEAINLGQKASNPIEEIFGIDQNSLKNIATHFDTLKLMKDELGKDWLKSDKSQGLLDNLAQTLDINKQALVENQKEIEFYLDAFSEMVVKKNEKTGKQTIEFTGKYTKEQTEKLNQLKEKLLNGEDIYKFLGDMFSKVTDATAETTQKVRESLAEVLRTGFNDSSAITEFSANLRTGLAEVSGSIQVVGNEVDGFRLKMKDGSDSPFLSMINEQLKTNSDKFVIAKNEAGQFQIKLQGVGESGSVELGLIKDGAMSVNDKLQILNQKVSEFKKNKSDSTKAEFLTILSSQVDEAIQKIGDLKITTKGYLDTNGLSGEDKTWIDGINDKLKQLDLKFAGTAENTEGLKSHIFSSEDGKQMFVVNAKGELEKYDEKIHGTIEKLNILNGTEANPTANIEVTGEEKLDKTNQDLNNLNGNNPVASPVVKVTGDDPSKVNQELDTMGEKNPVVDGKLNMSTQGDSMFNSLMGSTVNTGNQLMMNSLTTKTFNTVMNITTNTSQADTAISELKSKVESMKSISINASYTVGFENTKKAIQLMSEQVSKLNEKNISLKANITVGFENTRKAIQLMAQDVARMNQKPISVKANITAGFKNTRKAISNLNSQILNINKKYIALKGKKTAGVENIQKAIRSISKNISLLNNKSINLKINPATATTMSRIASSAKLLNNSIKTLSDGHSSHMSRMNTSTTAWAVLQKGKFSEVKSNLIAGSKALHVGVSSEFARLWHTLLIGAIKAKGSMSRAMRNMATAMKDSFRSGISGFYDLGKSIASKVAQGIKDNSGSAIVAIRRVATGVMGVFRNRINSRSLANIVANTGYRPKGSVLTNLENRPEAFNNYATVAVNSISNISNTYSAMSGPMQTSIGNISASSGNLNLGTTGDKYSIGARIFGSMATKKSSEMAELYKGIGGIQLGLAYREDAISKIESKMKAMTKNTADYRSALKELSEEYQQLMIWQKKEEDALRARQKVLASNLTKLSNTKRHTKKQREQYNSYLKEFEENNEKLKDMEITRLNNSNKIYELQLERYKDFVDEMVKKHDGYVERISESIDDTEFQLDVLSYINPDDTRAKLQLQRDILDQTYQLANQHRKKMQSMNEQYNQAVAKYGKDSEQANMFLEQYKKAEEAYEDAYLNALKLDKEMASEKEKIADTTVKSIKDSYSKIKDITTSAYEAEIQELEKLQEQKNKYYDSEIEKIKTIYSEKEKQRQADKEEQDYTKKLNELSQQRADLMNKIAMSSRDTSLEGRKYTETLKAELNKLNEDIAQTQSERQDELYSQQMKEQEELQISKLEALKKYQEANTDAQVENLKAQSKKVEEELNSKINDTAYWNSLIEQFSKGNTGQLATEYFEVSELIKALGSGNFGMVSEGFNSLSQEKRDEIVANASTEIAGLMEEQLKLNEELVAILGGTSENFSRDRYLIPYTDFYGSRNYDYKDWRGREGFNIAHDYTSTKWDYSTSGSKTPTSTTKPKTSTSTRYHTLKNSDTLWDLAWFYYNNPYKWKNIAEANGGLDPRKLTPGKRIIIPFRSGGYTGNWEGNDGRLALLHQKELVLNEDQTRHLLETIKTNDNIISALARMNNSNSIVNNANKTENRSFYIENLTYNSSGKGSPKKEAEDFANTLMTELKKR